MFFNVTKSEVLNLNPKFDVFFVYQIFNFTRRIFFFQSRCEIPNYFRISTWRYNKYVNLTFILNSKFVQIEIKWSNAQINYNENVPIEL